MGHSSPTTYRRISVIRRFLSSKAREFITVAIVGPRVLNLIWRSSPFIAMLLLIVELLSGVTPVAGLWLTKVIIDRIVASGNGPTRIVPLIVLFVVILCIGAASRALITLLMGELRDLVGQKVNVELMNKVGTMQGAAAFENPEFFDRLRNALEAAGDRPVSLLDMTAGLLSTSATFIGISTLLIRYDWRILVLLVMCALPQLAVELNLWKRAASVFWSQAPMARLLKHYQQLLMDRRNAVEIRLFDLNDYFTGLYKQAFSKLFRETQRVRRTQGALSLASSLISAGTVGACFAIIVLRAAQRTLTAGDVALFVGAVYQISGVMQGLINCAVHSWQNNLYMQKYFEFLNLSDDLATVGSGDRLVRLPLEEGIVVSDLSFRYPGERGLALDNVSLKIPAGQTIAIVGENGSGKTTLVKLLARLYDPTEGEILLDGVPLPMYNVRSLRRQMAVVLQDFGRFALSAFDNIGIGNTDKLDDVTAVEDAAIRAGIHEVVQGLPHGYSTLLDPQFEGGTALSGGEWQRLVLARALVRDAQILILDEPTAAMDARAEFDLYTRFAEITKGKTCILISHRLSAVRMADYLIVLHKGQVVEHGTHDELMALRGLYSDMYTKQAARYQLGDPGNV